jgi:para-nitrobenzyl esterase
MKMRPPMAAPVRAHRGALISSLAAGILVVTGVGASVPSWLFAIGHSKALAVTLVSPAAQSPLVVTSPAFHDGGAIPCRNTQYCGNVFPGLAWSTGPAGTRSYAVIIQGPGEGAELSLHLTMFNIPAPVTHLAAGMTRPPHGASLGPNVHGLHHAYAGPHPHGKVPNEYHLQVFALDSLLHIPAPVTFEKLVTAMQGHVLADGQLVGAAVQPSKSSRKGS